MVKKVGSYTGTYINVAKYADWIDEKVQRYRGNKKAYKV